MPYPDEWAPASAAALACLRDEDLVAVVDRFADESTEWGPAVRLGFVMHPHMRHEFREVRAWFVRWLVSRPERRAGVDVFVMPSGHLVIPGFGISAGVTRGDADVLLADYLIRRRNGSAR